MSTYAISNWQHGNAARGRFGMPTFGGTALLTAAASAAAFGTRERRTDIDTVVVVDVSAAQAPKPSPGTQVWSPPT